MQKLVIRNFGPVKSAEVERNRLFVLIGPQSSGKSTIAKLVFFFLQVRDEVTAFAIDCAESGQLGGAEQQLYKRLTRRFVEFFGPAFQPRDLFIQYEYRKDSCLQIALDNKHHKYVTLRFSDELLTQVRSLLRRSIGKFKGRGKTTGLVSTLRRLASEQDRKLLLEFVKRECDEIFGYGKELIFVPAGRSLLSTLSDQIQLIHPHLLDYPMRQFVEAVNTRRAFFSRSLDDIILEKRVLSSEPVWLPAVRTARTYVSQILKGEYRYDKDGGKIYVNPKVYTKIGYASSGQQESVWILLTLFLLVLEKSKALVIIEEPEAHLFPDAQKEIVEFIAFLFNAIECDFLVTTHSPYVLASINNLLYAKDLALRGAAPKVAKVIPLDRWLAQQEVGGCFVAHGSVEALKSGETAALKTELLDAVSNAINDEFERLLEIERETREHENPVGAQRSS